MEKLVDFTRYLLVFKTDFVVEKNFGKPKIRNGAYYEFQTKRGEWDVSGSMALTIRDGKIVTIQIAHTTSN